MTSNDEDPDPVAETAAGTPAEETELLPPVQVAPGQAWSNEEPGAVVLPQPWRSVWAIAAIGVLCAVVVAFAIFGFVAMFKDDHSGKQDADPTTKLGVPTAPASVSPAPTATQTVAVVAPPPAPTVTVTQVPTTVTAAAPPADAAPPPAAVVPPDSGSTHIFTICPDGHEGVVGGHTSCEFADNVRRTFYATGMSNSFTAYSPVTGDGYEITCVGRFPAYFTDGSTKISTRCYAGENAEVVIW